MAGSSLDPRSGRIGHFNAADKPAREFVQYYLCALTLSADHMVAILITFDAVCHGSFG